MVFELSLSSLPAMIAAIHHREATMAGKSPAAIHRETARTWKKRQKREAKLERKQAKRKGRAA